MPSVGDKKTVSFKLSNSDLGWYGGAGFASEWAAKKLIKEGIENAVVKAVGTKLVPGIGWASFAAMAIGFINEVVLGNDGFEFTVKLEYTEFYFHKEGYYIRGWEVTDIDVSVY